MDFEYSDKVKRLQRQLLAWPQGVGRFMHKGSGHSNPLFSGGYWSD